MHNKFSVYLLESPSKSGLLLNDSESDFLVGLFNKFDYPYKRKIIKGYKDFEKALSGGFENFYINNKLNPIIHLSMHGCRDGIALTDKTLVKWDLLSRLVEPLNKMAGGNLTLYLSACNTLFSQDMVNKSNYPFKYLVFSHGQIDLKEAILSSFVFYHYMDIEAQISEIADAMNKAICEGAFEIMSLEKIKGRKVLLNNFKKRMVAKRLKQCQKHQINPR